MREETYPRWARRLEYTLMVIVLSILLFLCVDARAQCPCNATTGATITFTNTAGVLSGCTVSNGGSYPGGATLRLFIFDGGGGTGAAGTATESGSAISACSFSSGGSGYSASTYVDVAPTCPVSCANGATVNAVCGLPGAYNSRPPLRYSSNLITNFNGQQGRAFEFYYGADGVSNNDPVIEHIHGGGDTLSANENNIDTWVLPSSPSPSWICQMVPMGVDIYAIGYQNAAMRVLSSVNASSTTWTVTSYFGGDEWWPHSSSPNYTVAAACDITPTVLEKACVTGQSGGDPATLTVTRGQDCQGNINAACAHTTSGQFAWAIDNTGADPALPSLQQDISTFTDFIVVNAGKGQIPGNPFNQRPWGVSAGSAVVTEIRSIGRNWSFSQSSNDWKSAADSVLTAAGLSTTYPPIFQSFTVWAWVADFGAINNVTYICAHNGLCPGGVQDGTEPGFVAALLGSSNWVAGCNVGTSHCGPVPTSTSITLGSGNNQGLAAVGTNTPYTVAQQYSAETCSFSGLGCALGTPTTGPLAPMFVATGHLDNDVTSNTQDWAAQQIPGVSQVEIALSGHENFIATSYSSSGTLPNCNNINVCSDSVGVNLAMRFLVARTGVVSTSGSGGFI